MYIFEFSQTHFMFIVVLCIRIEYSCRCSKSVRFQEELPAAISARSKCSLTHAELVKIMEWKLTVSTTEIDSHPTLLTRTMMPEICEWLTGCMMDAL